jgi:hypothetical protein
MSYSYATALDVQAAYEGELDLDSARLDYLLTVANSRLTTLIPALPNWIAEGLVDPVVAMDVVIRAILTRFRNPSDATSVSESVGPFSTTSNYKLTVAADELFSKADLAMLQPHRTWRQEPIHMRPWTHCHHRVL